MTINAIEWDFTHLAQALGAGVVTGSTQFDFGGDPNFSEVALKYQHRMAAGSTIVIDIWKDTFANYPPTVGDTIVASAKPTLSSENKSEDTTLTGWTTTLSKGDILYFNIDSSSTVTYVQLTLQVTKT